MKDLIQTVASMAATARAEFSASKTWSTSDDGAMSCMTMRVPVAMLNRIDELAAAAFIKPHTLSLDESDIPPAPPMIEKCRHCGEPTDAPGYCVCNGARFERESRMHKPCTCPDCGSPARDAAHKGACDHTTASTACRQCRDLDEPQKPAQPDDAVTALMDADWKLPETSARIDPHNLTPGQARAANWPFPRSVR